VALPPEKKEVIENVKKRLRELRTRIEKWAMVKIADVGEMNTVYREIGEIFRELAKVNPNPEAERLKKEVEELKKMLRNIKAPTKEEQIIKIFMDAGAREDELERVRSVVEMWKDGILSSEDVYYYLMGLSHELMIPLTPKQVGEIRDILGLTLS